jgi:hypothetical protein
VHRLLHQLESLVKATPAMKQTIIDTPVMLSSQMVLKPIILADEMHN